MPRNSTTGIYARVDNSFSNPVIGTIISPTDADTFFDDVETSMNSFIGTSTTSLSIAIGTKTFTTQLGKTFLTGTFVQALSQADPTNYMYGTVTSYDEDTGSLVLDVTVVGGSGTLADWGLIMAGGRGATGATGPAGPGYLTTSVSSQSIGSSGTKTFTVQSGLAYTAGARVRASDASNPATNYMEGVVSSYSGTTLAFTADRSVGSGTLTSWNINLVGDKGADGAGTGDVSSSSNFTADNRIVRTDRPTTDNKNVQISAATLDDSGNLSGIATLTTTGNIELGNASDTTISRTGAGAIAVEGVGVALNSTSLAHTASQYEVGNASDTTITRASAGVIAVEGVSLYPALPVTSKSTAYTTVLADANTAIYHPTADNNARTFTIDSNANVAYPVGTFLVFENDINTVTIAITSDTLVLAGAGTTGSRTLAANGIACAHKVASTRWLISGTGLT